MLKRPAKIPHTRDVLDFASVHLGTLARLTLHQQNVPGRKATVSPDILDDLTTRVENVQAFFAAYARQRLAEPGRAASVGLVSLCFACSTITRRYDRTPHSEALELANTRAAVLALRATCGSVVAGARRPSGKGSRRHRGGEAAAAMRICLLVVGAETGRGDAAAATRIRLWIDAETGRGHAAAAMPRRRCRGGDADSSAGKWCGDGSRRRRGGDAD